MGLWRARTRGAPDDAETASHGVKRATCASTPVVSESVVVSAPIESGSAEGCASTPAPKRPRRSRSELRRRDPELHELVGPANESAEAHRCRHDPPDKTCPRCRFYSIGASWVGAYGTLGGLRHGPERVIWIAERPARWGGPWGLGCTLCAQALVKASDHGASTPAGHCRRVRSGTAWARFEIRPRHLMSESIRLHVNSEGHRRAVAAHLAPNEPVRLLLQAKMEDDLLLQGAVPQPCDWLRAWQCVKNPSSWQAAADRAGTEHFIAQIRGRPTDRRAFKSMVTCMGEVLRRLKRKWMFDATSIFLAFDGKGGRKLLRFKCGVPLCFDAKGTGERTLLTYGARIGIVGCLPMLVGTDTSHYERDYAERTKDGVVTLLRRMLTPLGEETDDDAVSEVLLKVRGVAVDGQLLKTAQVMQQTQFPNIAITMRDPAHIIRISCRDPLHDADAFSEQYDRLFDRRHALLKEFLNSNVWREQLMACQRQILEGGGRMGGDLTSCLRDLQYVQPRFESFVTPRRRYVCLLRAVAHVLALKAGDERIDKAIRGRCEEALAKLGDSKDVFIAGLAGDYGEVCLQFLRYFDVHDHDPARTCGEMDEFTAALRQLFVDGYVVCSDGVVDVEGLEPRAKTLTQIAVEATKEPLIVSYGLKSWTLWNQRLHWSHGKAALRSMQQVAQDVIDRLSAEFHNGDLYAAYRLFDLDTWAVLRRSPESDVASTLTCAGQKMCGALGVVFDNDSRKRAALEALSVREQMLRRSANKEVDNRAAWRALIERGSESEPLVSVVLFYLSTWGGTGAVERGLGTDATTQKQHVGGTPSSCFDAEVHSLLLELNQEGPEREADMFTKEAEGGVLLFTEFSRACAQEWIRTHGRRFACYRKRKDEGSKAPRHKYMHTDRAVQLRARAAHTNLRKQAEEDTRASTAGWEAPERPTVLGVDRRRLMASVARLPAPDAGKKTKRFRAATARELAEKTAPCWTGRASGVLSRFLGGGLAVEAAAKSDATRAVQAKEWILRKARKRLGRGRLQGPGASTPRARKLSAKAKAASAPSRTRMAGASSADPQQHNTDGTTASASTPGARRAALTLARSAAKRQRMSTETAASSSRVAPAATPSRQLCFDASLETLVRQREMPSTTELLDWLKVVTQGGDIECEGKRWRLQPGVRSKMNINLNPAFVFNHPRLAGAIRSAIAASGGKWTTGKGAGSLKIARKIDFLTLLLRARRATTL